MKIRITGSSGRIYALVAQDIVVWYVRLSVLISPIALWEIYELIKAKGWIG